MQYLTNAIEIRNIINQFCSSSILWLDTEIADYKTPNRRISLIQLLADPKDFTGESAYIFDVLDKPDLTAYFIDQIMVNEKIEKVFHNAGFDLKYLGKKSAKNITCTYNIARKITKEVLQTSNIKLKTLAKELCHFTNVDTECGASDWGKRPLSQQQLNYAAMDVVYLAAVHNRLLDFNSDRKNNLFLMTDNSNSSINSNNYAKKNDNSSITATKVRVAFECPRLFYLNHKFDSKTLFIPQDTPTGIGTIFHSLADEFINLSVREPRFKALFQPEPSQLKVDKVALKMQQIFYRIKFFPHLQKTTKKDISKGQQLLQVWQGLQNIIKRFAQILIVNRHYCNADNVINKTFILENRQLKNFFDLPNGIQKQVRGEYDCLIYNYSHHKLCLIEFKTYQPVDPSAQLAQVSLYSYMLFQKKQLPVDSAVYCVLPEFNPLLSL